MARMPLEQFAREVGVAGSTLRYHARRGLIERAADGTVDVAQAREWQAQHEARIEQRAGEIETDSRLVRARVTAIVAKTQLARLKLNELARSVVDQAKAVEDAGNEIAEAMGTLRSLDPAPLLDLGLTADQAQTLRDEFVALLLADLGDPTAELRG